MPVYEYPQVPRTSQPQPHQAPEDQQPSHNDNRFSFLPTPAEARGYSWHRPNTNQRHSVIPPLPQLPEHLNAQQSHFQSTNSSQIQDEYAQAPQDLHRHPAPAYEQHYPEHPSGQPTSLVPLSDTSTLTRPSTSHTLNTTHEPQLSQDYKDTAVTMHYTQMPAPPSLDSEHQHHPPPPPIVAPDINPLTPTTPIKTHPNPRSNTTNMAILPPAHHNHTHDAASQQPTPSFSPLPQPLRGGTYHTTLFSCSAPTTCLTSLFCPCITYGRTQHRLSQHSLGRDPTNMLGYSICNTSCVAFGVLCGVNAVLAGLQRRRVRKVYGMEADGGAGGDECVRGVGCCCCSLAQDEREVRFREEVGRRGGVGGKDGRSSTEGYVPVGGMSFRAPPG